MKAATQRNLITSVTDPPSPANVEGTDSGTDTDDSELRRKRIWLEMMKELRSKMEPANIIDNVVCNFWEHHHQQKD